MIAFSASLSKNIRARNIRAWVVHRDLGGKISNILVGLGLFSGIVTYAILAGWTPMITDSRMVSAVLTGNVILLVIIGFLVTGRLWAVLVERRQALAGSKLHTRLVLLFSVVAVSPALLVAGFSVAFFDYGLQAWFNEKVRTAIDESNYIAQSYLREHQQNIRNDILGVSEVLNQESSGIYANTELLGRTVAAVAAARSIPEIVIFERSGRLRAKHGESFIIETEPAPPDWAFEDADQGKIAVLTSEQQDRVRALARLDRPVAPTYLYAGRFIDSQVLHRVEGTEQAVAEYEGLLANLSGIESNFAHIFLVVNMMLLLVAVWGGLHVATALVHPLGQLIEAAERVGGGDMTARVALSTTDNELSALGRSFNRMTSQLQTQQSELMAANRTLEKRREFIETVLSGVSAGVIGLDNQGIITVPNRSALDLLGLKAADILGRPLVDCIPEMAPLLKKVMQRKNRLVEDEIHLSRQEKSLILLVRIAAEHGPDGVSGYIITFDDVSDLVLAQRKAAWADIARRVAHEIKNPLTPIQLSAERLKRKYLKQISTDRETFSACTETIVRQVGDIGRMVDEFSAFARMPGPMMEKVDLDQLCQRILLLQEAAYPYIAFDYQGYGGPLIATVDSRQIGQLLNNLIKNCAESIDEKHKNENNDKKPHHDDDHNAQKIKKGHIVLTLRPENDGVLIVIEDDGCGFPKQRDRLIEPYVTTREKGTGLGLAVVTRIVEDHDGLLALEDRQDGGARVRIMLPLDGANIDDHAWS